MTTQPNARILLDSLHPDGVSRVTTMEVTMHGFVAKEFLTHRSMSRNGASNRAIPLAKQIERVRTDPAIPISWPKEQKGMQGGEELTGYVRTKAIHRWHTARNIAADLAWDYLQDGAHKSVASRLLEPFLWATYIVTATDWDGFWAQRCSPLAQPEMRAAAEAMRAAYLVSEPEQMYSGCWHLPLISDAEEDELFAEWERSAWFDDPKSFSEFCKRISAARCARVSYLTHDGKRDPDADLKLATRLLDPGSGPPHWSPFEHVCRPIVAGESKVGNLRGWRQFRHELEGRAI